MCMIDDGAAFLVLLNMFERHKFWSEQQHVREELLESVIDKGQSVFYVDHGIRKVTEMLKIP